MAKRATAQAKKKGPLGSVRRQGRRYYPRYERAGQEHTPGRGFATEELAWGWLRAEQVLIDRDEWTSPAMRRKVAEVEEAMAALTFGDYARPWIEARVTPKGSPLHPRTKAEYTRYVDGILKPLAAMPLASITPADVKAWHEGHADVPTLRHAAYMFAKSVFKTALEVDELILRNPCMVEHASRKPAPKVDSDKAVRALTHEAVYELAGLVQPCDRLLILLLAYCCLRSGEACALRRRDITMGTDDGAGWGLLAVERAITTYGGQRHEGETKTGAKGARVVPIPPHLLPEVEAHLARFAEHGPDGLLFPSSNPAIHFRSSKQIDGHKGKPARPNGTGAEQGYGWAWARIEAGFPKLRMHDLRHWGITLWDEAGTPDAIRRALAGHAQPGMTGRYTHADARKAAPYAQRVSELAGWRPPLRPAPTTSSAPSGNAEALAHILRGMDAEQLAATLAALPEAQRAEVLPHVPAENLAAVIGRLADPRPKLHVIEGVGQ